MSRVVITEKGKELSAKVMDSSVKVEFTKMQTSAIRTSIDKAKTLTSIENVQHTTSIHRIVKPSKTGIQIQSLISNTESSVGYNVNTIGIFARSSAENAEEILYAVAIETEQNGPYMPPYNGQTPTTFYLKINLEISNSENVRVVVDEASGITHGDLLHIESIADKNKELVDEVYRAYKAGELKGDKGDVGPQGEKGNTGDRGPQGVQGAQGIQGTIWHEGNMRPDAGIGRDNDFFINSTDNKYYKKLSGKWRELGSIKGDPGPQGEIGPQGPRGIQGPIGETGPRGEQGPRGMTGATGEQGPTGPRGKDGVGWARDFFEAYDGEFFIGNSGDILQKVDGSPKPTGVNIKGPKGERGPGLTVQVVSELPSTPDSSTLYLIKE